MRSYPIFSGKAVRLSLLLIACVFAACPSSTDEICPATPAGSCTPLQQPIPDELIVEIDTSYTVDEVLDPNGCYYELFLFQLGTDFLGVHPDSINILNLNSLRRCNCNLILLEVDLPDNIDINDGKVGSMSPPEDQNTGIIASVGLNHRINIGPVNSPYDTTVLNTIDTTCVVYYSDPKELEELGVLPTSCIIRPWPAPISDAQRDQLTVVAGIDTGTDPLHAYNAYSAENWFYYSREDMQSMPATIVNLIGEPIQLNGEDNDQDCVVDDIWGMDYFHEDNNPVDRKGHGTHIAGTILSGQQDANSGIRLMTLQIGGYRGDTLDQDHFSCDLFSILCAIDYAVQNEADVMNMSLGYYSQYPNKPFHRQIRRAREAGILMVTSLGNDGVNVDSCLHWPSNFSTYFPDHVIAVAALDTFTSTSTTYQLAGFSNRGQRADLAAPGYMISSARAGTPNAVVPLSGTSMAAAVVSRRAAMIRDSIIQAGGTITAAQVKAQILQEAEQVTANICVGNGRVLTPLNDPTLMSAIGYD